ncbi:hypothetical protein L1987_03066 [Smallanthus sonchifolius]|uniref:Uncharacterized protein n=1 Tax=Smallanthus sonchifolius TaxID=185202 RepID=A0ACB9K9R3_9ASTR|nr:hypothetical protein L1987_03066 [Smallanthus sonchifolius]
MVTRFCLNEDLSSIGHFESSRDSYRADRCHCHSSFMTTLHSQYKPNFISSGGKNKTAATKRSESGSSKVQGSHPLCSVDIPNSPTPPGATGSGSTANRPSFHHHETK